MLDARRWGAEGRSRKGAMRGGAILQVSANTAHRALTHGPPSVATAPPRLRTLAKRGTHRCALTLRSELDTVIDSVGHRLRSVHIARADRFSRHYASEPNAWYLLDYPFVCPPWDVPFTRPSGNACRKSQVQARGHIRLTPDVPMRTRPNTALRASSEFT